MGTDTDDNNPLLSDERKRKYIRNLRYINIAVAYISSEIKDYYRCFVTFFIGHGYHRSNQHSENISNFVSGLYDVMMGLCQNIFGSFACCLVQNQICAQEDAIFEDGAREGSLLFIVNFTIYSLSSVIFYYFYAIGDQVLGYVAAFCLLFSALMYLAIHFGCSRGISQQDLQGHYDQTYRQRLV